MKLLELFSGTHSIGKVAEKKGYEITSLDRDLGASHDDYTSASHIKEDIMTWDYKQFPEGTFDVITASPVCLFWSRLRNTWIGRKCESINPDGSIVKKEDIQRDIEQYGKPMVDKIIEIINYFKPKYWWIENPQTGKMKDYISETYPNFNTYYDVDYCKYSNWGYQKRTRFWTNIKNFTPKLCKKDCENIIIIKTQKGDKHTGYNKPIKGDTRTLHASQIGAIGKGKSINNALEKNEVYQKVHKDRMGTSKTVLDNGKLIRVNTKALREKYKDYENIQQVKTCHKKSFGSGNKSQTCVGGGSNRLERYRIPAKLIDELLPNP